MDLIGETIGWAGNILLALCAIPQAIKCYRNGHSKGLDKLFVWMWYIGEMGACFYHNFTSDRVPQNINYLVNIIAISVIVYYRHFPREEQNEGIREQRIREQDNSVEKESIH